MAEEGFAWIYLVFFLVIPLSRILPRLIRKWKEKNQGVSEQFTQKTYQSTNETFAESPQKTRREEISKELNPQTLDMLVLGELNRGTKILILFREIWVSITNHWRKLCKV